ncbi:MAG: flagellar M-ring protein FliF [Desulfovibrio sp.]|nr:flagellar M-ring protein FliF [Desulfovibrio sp.]
MAQQKPNPSVRLAENGAPSLEELRAQRRERAETNRRVEDLKLRLLRITEQHMDQAVRLIRRWLRAQD